MRIEKIKVLHTIAYYALSYELVDFKSICTFDNHTYISESTLATINSSNAMSAKNSKNN